MHIEDLYFSIHLKTGIRKKLTQIYFSCLTFKVAFLYY